MEMLSNFFKFLFSFIPVIGLPSFIVDFVLGLTEFCYWANYFLPMDTIAGCCLGVIAIIDSLHIIKFLLSLLKNDITFRW